MKQIHHEGYRRLVDRLQQARIRKGLTQGQAAAGVGKRRSWWGKIEQHELKLDVIHLIAVCRVVGLKADELVRQMEEEMSSEEDPSSYLLEIPRFVGCYARYDRDVMREATFVSGSVHALEECASVGEQRHQSMFTPLFPTVT